MLGANTLAHKPAKILCMATLGELVKEWRTRSGLTTRQLADRVGHKVKRQHIEQLEAAGDRLPRYLAELAEAMGTTADQLLKGKMPPLLHEQAAATVAREPVAGYSTPPAVAPGFKDPPRDTAWQVMQDLDYLHPDDRATWIAELHRMAEKARQIVALRADKLISSSRDKSKAKK